MVCYDQNLQKHKYLSTISMLLHKTFRTGLIFISWSKWVQTEVCYDQNLQKHKYLSTISIFLHETFRTGLIFSELVAIRQNSGMLWSKLTETYIAQHDINISAQNLPKQDSFFWDSRNECKHWYAMIKTYKNINISARYQCFCMKPSEQGSFYQDSENESKQW